MRLSKAADKVRDSIEETLTFMYFPEEHWMRIRTNNTLERFNREIKRRTKDVGTFPDGDIEVIPYMEPVLLLFGTLMLQMDEMRERRCLKVKTLIQEFAV